MPLDASMSIIQEYVALGDPQAETAAELARRIAGDLLEHAPGDMAASAAIRYIRAKGMWRDELAPTLARFFGPGVPIPGDYVRQTADAIERMFGERIADPVIPVPVKKKPVSTRRKKG